MNKNVKLIAIMNNHVGRKSACGQKMGFLGVGLVQVECREFLRYQLLWLLLQIKSPLGLRSFLHSSHFSLRLRL